MITCAGCGRRQRLAFTLVELLVVISIIALLIGILLPVLRSAREMARSAACGSNMRQLGIAWFTYQSDYNDELPVAGSWLWTNEPNNTGNIWPTLMKNYISDIPTPAVKKHNPAGGNNPSMSSGDPFELGGIMMCPSMPEDPGGAIDPTFNMPDGTFDGRFVHYGINGLWSGGAGKFSYNTLNGYNWPSHRRVDSLLRTSERIAFSETAFFIPGDAFYSRKDIGWHVFRGWKPGVPDSEFLDGAFRHNDATNSVFADGHVENNVKDSLIESDATARLFNGPLSVLD